MKSGAKRSGKEKMEGEEGDISRVERVIFYQT